MLAAASQNMCQITTNEAILVIIKLAVNLTTWDIQYREAMTSCNILCTKYGGPIVHKSSFPYYCHCKAWVDCTVEFYPLRNILTGGVSWMLDEVI